MLKLRTPNIILRLFCRIPVEPRYKRCSRWWSKYQHPLTFLPFVHPCASCTAVPPRRQCLSPSLFPMKLRTATAPFEAVHTFLIHSRNRWVSVVGLLRSLVDDHDSCLSLLLHPQFFFNHDSMMTFCGSTGTTRHRQVVEDAKLICAAYPKQGVGTTIELHTLLYYSYTFTS
jgi:hypothetical protein